MRRIIKIDESKCDGCGLCAEICHEEAIVIKDGKAKLVSESYCDGLGDCLGECPQNAITFEERDAEPYDETAVKKRITQRKKETESAGGELPCGCPGSLALQLKAPAVSSVLEQRRQSANDGTLQSELANWPVQIKLVPNRASYLEGAELLIAADCTAFSYPNFHRGLLSGKVCLIGCPKLDEVEDYIEKISQIIKLNKTPQIDVAYMEVPCCGGLVRLVKKTVLLSGEPVMLNLIKLSLDGKILEIRKLFPN